MKGGVCRWMGSAAEGRSQAPSRAWLLGPLGPGPILRASFCPVVFPSGHSYLERLLNVEVPQKVG